MREVGGEDVLNISNNGVVEITVFEKILLKRRQNHYIFYVNYIYPTCTVRYCTLPVSISLYNIFGEIEI